MKIQKRRRKFWNGQKEGEEQKKLALGIEKSTVPGPVFAKGNRTLRQRMTSGFLLAALIPVLIFAVFSQIHFWTGLRENTQQQIQNNLRYSNQCLDMILDKYRVLLYDFCTDREVIEMAEKCNVQPNSPDREKLQQRMSHICEGNIAIEGITLLLPNEDILFYDRLNASSTESSWANEVEVSVPGGDTEIYRWAKSPALTNGRELYLFQIARDLGNTPAAEEGAGTVIFSVNQNVLSEALAVGNGTKVYLLEKDTIVSAENSSLIGKELWEIEDTSKYRYTTQKNDLSGLTICNVQPITIYRQTFEKQVGILALITAGVIAVMIFLIRRLTKPYLTVVDEYLSVMNSVEQGDFSVKIKDDSNMPAEIRRIGDGFNEMVAHVESLMEQVKQAVVEQKNAELYALEAQMDPHFLYNTLDTINWKAIEKKQYEISEMVGALADILRYTIYNAGGTTTIRQELSWLNEYILLQNAKKGKELDVRIYVPEELMGRKIHKLLLQPIVENAIKHGFGDREDKDILVIQIRESGEQLHIMIANNGIPIPEETLAWLNSERAERDGHLGIGNVKKRLKLYYGEKAALYFESEAACFTKVHLFIPGKEEDECESQS